jgi:hypothetical protein
VSRKLIEFKAILIDRGKGTGAKRIMESHPERAEFIRQRTGWERVEAGTLTLDHAVPLPLQTLSDMSPLGEEPAGLIANLAANDARIAGLRGQPKYYGGIASSRNYCRHVVLSQQPRQGGPASAEDYKRYFSKDRSTD